MIIPTNASLFMSTTEPLSDGFTLCYKGDKRTKLYNVYITAPDGTVCTLYYGGSFKKAQEKYVELHALDCWRTKMMMNAQPGGDND